jgi:hypothetical protein
VKAEDRKYEYVKHEIKLEGDVQRKLIAYRYRIMDSAQNSRGLFRGTTQPG